VYKAVHRQNGEEILTLSLAWRERKDELRALDHADLLLCQGCLQPVRLKAGRFKRVHFAHKHLQGCSYGEASSRLLAARALLYEKLSLCFPGRIDAEWKPPELVMPRPVDLVFRPESGGLVIYWLADTLLKYETRLQLREAFKKLGARIIWVLGDNLIRPDPNHPAWNLLSPFERDCLSQTRYDEIGKENRLFQAEFGSTLHYLDDENARLITYRSLERVHAPNVFSGSREVHLLKEIDLDEDGEFVHPGEGKALAASQAARGRQVERVRRWLQPGRPASSPQQTGGLAPFEAQDKPRMSQMKTQPDPVKDHSVLREQVTCIFCGRLTDDWWSAWTEDGARLGKCRDCLDKGYG
jgi:hypothetical protein